jgi:pimeloyl-ACP methyl ester carboxylesterase
MSRPIALLIHSGGFTSRQWRKLGQRLAATHDVMAPDLIGYGDEPWPPGVPFHYRQDVDRLIGMLESPDAAGRPADVVGHSYGGLLALQIALRRPDLVRSLAAYRRSRSAYSAPGRGAPLRTLPTTTPTPPASTVALHLRRLVERPGRALPADGAGFGGRLEGLPGSRRSRRHGSRATPIIAPTLLLGGAPPRPPAAPPSGSPGRYRTSSSGCSPTWAHGPITRRRGQCAIAAHLARAA